MSAEPSAIEGDTSTKVPLMLVVGDPASAHAAAARLEPAGVRTVSALSGPDAAARLSELAPDLVLVNGDEVGGTDAGQVVQQIRNAAGKRPPASGHRRGGRE